MLRGVKLISLDVTNTLIKLRRQPADTYADFAARFGFKVDRESIRLTFPKAFKQLELENPCFGIKTAGPLVWWTELMSSCYGPSISEHPSFPALTRQLYDHYSKAEAWELTSEENIQTLHTLRDRGFKLSVLSNFDSRLHGILSDLRITNFFDRIFVSGESGMQKPDPQSFKLVLDHFGISDPKSCVHVGDNLEKDYRAAKTVGLHGLLIAKDPSSEVPRAHQMSSLRELESLLVEQ